MINFNSLTFKLLVFITAVFVLANAAIFILVGHYSKKILYRSNESAYAERVDTIIRVLTQNHERLKKTGLVDAYIDDFQRSALKFLRTNYYDKPDPEIYPFILNADGAVILHPTLNKGDQSFTNRKFMPIPSTSSKKYTFHQDHQDWHIHKIFQSWHWNVGYSVPLKTMFQETHSLSRVLLFIMAGANVFLVIISALVVTRFTKPIMRLTDASTEISRGNLNQSIDVSGSEEVRILSSSFDEMRMAVKKQIVNLNKEIGERKQAQKELQKHRENLEELVAERTAQLSEAKAQAEAANAAKSGFLARMSHEIRTPLNAIIGLTNIVLKSDLKAGQREILHKVQLASKNLLHVISDILDFSKVEAGRLELAKAPFDLKQVLAHQADLFSENLARKGLKIRFRMSPQVPRHLTGDSGRLTQVLSNLVGNAIKFTQKGEIAVGVDLYAKGPMIGDATSGQTALVFSIQDTGIGIAPDLLPTLFDPFTQADESLTRGHEGTGLGLAICRQLVQLMGGRIWAESKPGKGSTFFFTVLVQTYKTAPEAIASEPPQALVTLPVHQLTGRRVLLVEDSALNMFVAVALLEDIGLAVETAGNGLEGVEKVTGSEPGYYDAVLMDIQMPVMDGYDATNRIRAWEAESKVGSHGSRPTVHRTPIIALTAHALIDEKAKCLAAGMDDYLAKPIDDLDLQRVLLKWITPEQKEKIL